MLVVFAYGFAVLFTGLTWRAWLRRLRIAGRPVLSIAEVADAEPGTAVVVAGRTAGGPPLLTGPWSGVRCVWWEDEVTTMVHHSSERFEYLTTSEQSGDANLHDAGARVEIAPALGRRWLLGGHERMMRQAFSRDYSAGGGRTEYVVDADTAVVVAGVVEIAAPAPGGRRLGHVHWADGTARARLDEITDRLMRTQRLFLVSALSLTLVAVVLTVT
ncbi:hypothetical protein DFJ67_3386 [Asanoa ferruginea]|uniref:Uncharacterized protein n=1 Tax=Asanoa ferruginea TaxID=53367 RepID=A0A3D9ZJ33_9ACTN|nr:hypothetical protein DFJ67_3386 [Asanoa ferruginea]GIF51146.1 hypothetical protein Afe04nite_56850 [Asanoa ferruginea]